MKNVLGAFSFKGVIVGSLFDVIGTGIWGIVEAIYLTVQHASESMPPSQVAVAVATTMRGDPAVWTVNLVVGGLFSIGGGYISARIAGQREMLNGALASFLCVGLGLYSLASGVSDDPLWLQLVLLVLSPALALLGGSLRLRQRTRSRHQQPAY